MTALFKIFSKQLPISYCTKQFVRNKSRCKFDDLFVIVRAVPNEFPDILDLFRANYNMKEPTMVGIGLAGKQNIAFDNQLMSGLLQGMTLVTKCRSSGLIAGACVNIGTCNWDSYRNSKLAESCNCEKMKQIMKFFAFVTQAPNLYNHCHQMKIFEMSYLTTDSLNIGQGIGFNLVKKSMELGKDLSYKIIRIDCTNYYTAVICERLKMQKVFEIAYKDYVGPDGLPVIQPPKPHTSLKVYVNFPHKCVKK